MEIRIGSPQPPESGGAPFRGDFRPLCVAEESVTKIGGKQKVYGRRIRFQVRLSHDVLAEKVVVMVVKSRDVDVEFLSEETAVTEFVTVELFRREIGIGVESREIG